MPETIEATETTVASKFGKQAYTTGHKIEAAASNRGRKGNPEFNAFCEDIKDNWPTIYSATFNDDVWRKIQLNSKKEVLNFNQKIRYRFRKTMEMMKDNGYGVYTVKGASEFSILICKVSMTIDEIVHMWNNEGRGTESIKQLLSVRTKRTK